MKGTGRSIPWRHHLTLVCQDFAQPGQNEPMTDGRLIGEQLNHAVDAVIDSGDCGTEPTKVIDFCQRKPEVVRRGAGDTSGFRMNHDRRGRGTGVSG
jgi:tRNA A37 threonylcarbamoyladenosine synthetase subunit TsaC/SUA5/YrdC